MHEKLEAMNDACVLEGLLINLPSLLWKAPGWQPKPHFEPLFQKPPERKFPICFRLAWPLHIQPSLVADKSAIILSEILFFYLTGL